MKNNKKKVAVVLLLAVVAVGSYFVSGTYAKYSRALSGSDEATVAKFSVTATDLNKEQNATIDLFGTLKEANVTDAEENVKADRIAPGTGGQFTTTLTNASEVDVEAVVTLSETNASNVPIEYSLDKTTWKKASDLTGKVTLDYDTKTGGTTTDDVTVYWRWAIDAQADADDTTLGEMATAPKVTTKVTVTFNQVD